MASSTIYDVVLRYTLQDRVTRGMKNVEKATDKAAKSAFSLERAMALAGAATGAFFAGKAASQSLIGFNADLEQAKIQMAGLMKLNLGGAWSKNMAEANSMVSDFQQIAKQSVGTTKDFVDMASMVVRPLTNAGASMQDVRDITKGAVVAAQAFGIASDVAARDVEEALMGNLTKVSKFARALLEPRGWTTEVFNALDPAKRLSEVRKAFQDPAILEMAKAQGESWSGITSTLQDNLQMALGRTGLPLMKKITAEVKRWNEWIERNPHKIQEITDKVGSALADGFGAIKSAVQWIADNKDTLLALAKAALLLKGGNMIGNAIASPFSALADYVKGMQKAKEATGGFVGKLGGIAQSLTGVATALGAVAAGASLLASYVLNKREAELTRQAQVQPDAEWFLGVGTKYRMPGTKGIRSRLDDARASGMLRMGKNGYEVDQGALAQGLGRGDDYKLAKQWMIPYQQSQKEVIASQNLLRLALEDAAGMYQDAIRQGWMAQAAVVAAKTLAYTDDLIRKAGKPAAKGTKVSVTINRIEVQSDDPDRFAFGLVEAFRDAAKNPSAAYDALREG